MGTPSFWRDPIIVLVAMTVINAGFVNVAVAGIIDTDSIVRPDADSLKSTTDQLRERVRSQLSEYGVKGAIIDRRLASLNRSELAGLSEGIHSAPAGEGGALLVVGVLVGLWLLLGFAINWNKDP